MTAIRTLGGQLPDRELAVTLNRMRCKPVDGKAWTGDPGQIPLGEHTQIVLNLGGPIVTPPAIDWGKTQL